MEEVLGDQCGWSVQELPWVHIWRTAATAATAATADRQRGGELAGLSTDRPVASCHHRRRLLVEEFLGDQCGWSV